MEDMKDLINLIGKDKYDCFLVIKNYIEENYNLQQTFREQNIKTKKWKYEFKFTKGSKTICGFYFADNCLGFMIILGKNERKKFDDIKEQLSNKLIKLYNETNTYHDGKWLMIELNSLELFEDLKKILYIKRKTDKQREI